MILSLVKAANAHCPGGEGTARELALGATKRNTGDLYIILIEPNSTGLHSSDINQLLRLVYKICADGADKYCIIVFEHQPRCYTVDSDWIYDSGTRKVARWRGNIIATGTPRRSLLFKGK